MMGLQSHASPFLSLIPTFPVDNLSNTPKTNERRTEREVMARVRGHPFIVRLAFAFHTRDRAFLVSEFMAGGDLFTLMRCVCVRGFAFGVWLVFVFAFVIFFLLLFVWCSCL